MIRPTLIAVATLALVAPAALTHAQEVLVGTPYNDIYYGDTPDHLRVWGDSGGYVAESIWARPTVHVSYPQYYGGRYYTSYGGSYYSGYPCWTAQNTTGTCVIFGANAYVALGNPFNITTINVGTGSGYYYGWPVIVSQSTCCERPYRGQCTTGYGGYRDPACGWSRRNLEIVRRTATSPIYRATLNRSGRGSFRTGSTYVTQPQWGLSRVDRATGRSLGIQRPSIANSPSTSWDQPRSVYRGTNLRGPTQQAVPRRAPTVQSSFRRGSAGSAAGVRRGPTRTAVQRGSFRTGSGRTTRNNP